MVTCIIGLGNTEKYSGTRHNIGYDFLIWFCLKHNLTWKKKKNCSYAEYHHYGKIIYLCISDTYMNSSGEIIPTIKNFFSVATDMVVIHDDLELEYGFCKLRNNKERGLRSHNGLRSIAHYLNNDLPYFLSVGIGRPEHNEEVSVFVLKKFTHLEMEKQQEIYAKIIYLLGLT